MQDLLIIRGGHVIIQSGERQNYTDTRANFEKDGGPRLTHKSVDYNRTIGSCWLDGEAFQEFPNMEFEAILDNAQTYIDAKERRERVAQEREEAERVANMTDEEVASQVRTERDRKIAETDWYMMPDYPADPETLEVVKNYRKALRDITLKSGFPRDVEWPVMPRVFCKDTEGTTSLGLAKVGIP